MLAGACTPTKRWSAPVLLAAVCVLALFTPSCRPQQKDNQTAPAGLTEWQVLAEGDLVRLEAQAVLYRAADGTQCLVRLRVTNVSAAPVGAAVTDDPLFVFPNQWSTSPEPRRRVIDELEFLPKAITTEERERVLGAYHASGLAAVPPGGSANYWRAFSGQCPSAGAVPSGHYLIFSLSGRLRVTDGQRVEELTLLGAPPETRDVVMRPPLRWQPLPPGAQRVPP